MIDEEKIEDEFWQTLQRLSEVSKDRTKYKEFKQLRKKALELQQTLWRAQ